MSLQALLMKGKVSLTQVGSSCMRTSNIKTFRSSGRSERVVAAAAGATKTRAPTFSAIGACLLAFLLLPKSAGSCFCLLLSIQGARKDSHASLCRS